MISHRKDIYFWGFPYLFLSALLYVSIYGVRLYVNYQNNPQHLFSEFQNEIKDIESRTKIQVDFLISNFDTNAQKRIRPEIEWLGEADNRNKIYLFTYQKDSLIYWNNNEVIIPDRFLESHTGTNFVCQLKNGWYGFQHKQMGSYHFLGCYLIKNEFPFQNEFVRNQISPRFNLPSSVELSIGNGQYPVYSIDRTYLFSLSFNKHQAGRDSFFGVIFLLFIFGSSSLFFFLFHVFSGLGVVKTGGILFVLYYCITIIFLRIVQNCSGFPAELYHSELFSPGLYSSSVFLPSLGDFTLNVILLFVLSLVVFLKISIPKEPGVIRISQQFVRNVILLFILLILFQIAGYFVTDLVINSSFSLNLQNISGLTCESGYGLFIITVLLFSMWLVSSKIIDIVFFAISKIKWLVLSSIILTCLYCLMCLLVGWDTNYIVLLFFLVYVAASWYFKAKKSPRFSVQSLLFFLCFYAAFATFLLNGSNHKKESEKINLMAAKLLSRRNPVTEVLYEQVERRLLVDSILNQWIKPYAGDSRTGQDSLVNYLKKHYFKDYWKKYQIQITYCDPTKELQIQPQGYLINCNSYFHGIINNFGEPTILPNLFFLDYGFGKEYYLAIISRKAAETNAETGPTIFIEFNLKNAYPDPGYPGLLMDKTRFDLPNLSDYSYGIFQNRRLVRAVGVYGYKMELSQYKKFSEGTPCFTEDERVHFQYHINETDVLLISKKEDSLLSFATPFSYLFILFSAIALLVAVAVHFPKHINPFPLSLRNRLHFSLIGILVMTIFALGILQAINIIQINSRKDIDNLRERAHSVVVEIQQKYGEMREMSEVSKSELEDFLIKLSNVFFTDINVYHVNGMLISSSREQIFEEGLLSERMNAVGYRKLIIEKNSIFIQNEAIGTMQFKSAYLPFYNDHNQLLGFINLPYFAKQDESKKEISAFLVTLLNVYILLILFGIFITILISNHITAPLTMLAKKMSQLRLGMVNEKIVWKQNDEIGQLVSDYNRMIDELGKSAELLARSERESAWREMARQVAHEIKNPLTPMKLSAQYLLKAWNEKAPDWDQRLARFTKTLVEQIDSLSVIASDFSDFAKMPAVVLTKINLEEIVLHVLSLYRDYTQIQYEFQSEGSELFISGDRSQLIRLFTNLMNNAVQAIGGHHEGIIRIYISRAQQQIIVKVSDNGCGISPERSERIFQPDFTTKTSGMGLGLAIVKGIVEGMNGEISFTSEEYKGTTFIIKFPVNDAHT